MIVMFKYVTLHWDEPSVTLDEEIAIGGEIHRLGWDEYFRRHPLLFTSDPNRVAIPASRPHWKHALRGALVIAAMMIGGALLLPVLLPVFLVILVVAGATTFWCAFKRRRFLRRCLKSFNQHRMRWEEQFEEERSRLEPRAKRVVQCNACDQRLAIPANGKRMRVTCTTCSAQFFEVG
jgi:hypothetical protein